jgi:hypothetical protein
MSALSIIKHTSLASEKFSKNGIQKNVHVVVKNTPFVISLQLNNEIDELERALNDDITSTSTSTENYNFQRLTVEASLLYDCEQEREVGFIRAKPLEYKCHVGADRHDQCHIELRIKVLSSQLEDMFFRVRFRTIDSMTKEVVDRFSVLTDPIKVISKPDQLKKKTKSKKRPLPSATKSLSSSTSAPSVATATVDPALVQALVRIEQQQAEQQKLLELLTKKTHKAKKLTVHSTPSQQQPTSAPAETNPSPTSPLVKEKEDFDTLFTSFMSIYNSLGSEDRPAKIRKLVRTLPTREVEKLSELLDMFWAEGFQQDLRRGAPSSLGDMYAECTPEECPHRRELERIDEFYKEFMTPFLPGDTF